MKKTLLYLLLILSFSGICQQQGTITLDWSENLELNYDTFKVDVPHFNSEGFNYDNYNKVVLFQLKVPVTSYIDESALQITNVTSEPLTQLGELNASAIPSDINVRVMTQKAREELFAVLSLSPIFKDGSGYRKVTSFTYSIGASTARMPLELNNVSAISNSVLASGDWFRFYVEKSGVYKLSKSFLQSLGLNVNGDPRKIKIYGNGGRMLPLLNSTYYPDDLAENAIQLVGENDGSFDSQDYVLFYAEGVDNWNMENESHNNLYSDRSYYYVTTKGGDGKRIPAMDPMSNAVATNTFNIFDDYQFHEKDLINIARVGRRWFGEAFNITSTQTFQFTIPDIVPASVVELSIASGATAFTQTSFTVDVNGATVGTLIMAAIPDVNSGITATGGQLQKTFPATQDVAVKLTYNNNGVPGSNGYLDYIILKSKRNLRGFGKQFRFQNNQSATLSGVAEYQVSNATNISQVWDITDINNVTRFENANQPSFSFKAPLGELRKYIAIDPADFYTPLKESKARVANQDLRGTIFNNSQGQFQDIDYIIITPLNLKSQADRLAAFHRGYSQLNVKVVDLESIYHEFGSGKQDVAAIRNFVKYVYTNASSPNNKVKYLNLFGDGSFDFKDRIPNNNNILPTYQAVNSFSSGESSYSSDDFYALMDPNEGNLLYTFVGGIDIAVGRMVVDNLTQATEMVTKVLDYHDKQSYGSWRNNVIIIADDADKTADATLQNRQNNLSDMIYAQKPFINVKKIFLDSYLQEASAGGNRYPKAREDLFNSFEKGALVFNYLGHGGEDGLSGERIWEKSDGQNLSNRYKYPLFITITCEFSRFDNPYRPTAGEYTYWNPLGGAIAMLTTIRSIGQGQAEIFNDVLSQRLFNYGAGAGEQTTIAEALRRAKNSSPSSASNVVFYLGDPALMLALPKPNVRLTKVNDQPVTGTIDDLKALGFVKLTGEILDENNVPLSNYNGELAVNIFDKPLVRATLNNDGNAAPMNFNTLGETIFRGNASVANGQFEFSFVVPKDIRIPVGNGRISFYAERTQTLLDKSGFDTSIKVGGINENAAADNVGPQVKLYMNDQTFISGGITNESPIFLAYLEDLHGINTASGIGHDITAILDGDENNPVVLNDYYETELDDYKQGKLQFPFRNLEKGLHTITFKAWDVYNNPVTSEIQFIVVGDETITLKNVLNYPNPFVNYTQFWFTHNRPFEPLEVQVQVITVTGKVVWTKNQIITTDGFLSREITWDGKDDFGDRIGKGVYVYKLTVKSSVTNSKTEKYEKLVIL